MALRLRRGTDAERQLITPAEGELIYTTDTKSVYIGDGVTVGGIIVSGEIGLGDLAEVDLSTPPAIGQVLKWDGTKFVPSNDVVGSVSGDGVVEGSNYRINIVGDDSSVIVNTSTSTVTGTFVGDGNGLTNLNISAYDIFELNNVFESKTPETDDLLIFDGFNFVPDRIERIIADDDTIMLDIFTNTFTGIFDGDGSRLFNVNLDRNSNYEINIIGSDSSLLLDSTNGIHYGIFQGNLVNNTQQVIFNSSSSIITIEEFNSTTNAFRFTGADTNSTNEVQLELRAKDNIAILQLSRVSDNDISSDDIPYGAIYFERGDPISGFYSPCAITGRIDGLAFIADNTGEFPEIKTLKLTDFGDLGLGTYTPTAKLDVRGNAVFEGDVQAAAFKGSVVADDSTIIIDGLSGTITAQGFIQFGSYTDAEIALITPVNGMVYYNSTNNKFRGYQGGTWINLDGTTI